MEVEEMKVRAENLSKFYGKNDSRVIALNHVDVVIEEQEFVSITGASGSGKSTLLHLLSGLDFPSTGTVFYNAQNIYSLNDSELSQMRGEKVGFIFQQFNLMPVLTARENIQMPLMLTKKKNESEYFYSLVESLGLTDRLDHFPNELSGGQQQRVAIARALISQPDIIFADEPTGNLDSKNGAEVIEILKRIWEDMRTTIVLVTHDQKLANLASKQYRMIDGRLMEV